MRTDRKPYWVKKIYLLFRRWYANHFLRPACDSLGDYHTIMKPWYVDITGPNIRIGKCATIIGEPQYRVALCVWGRAQNGTGSGSITIGDYVIISPGVRISASDEIVIGDSCMIANSAYITDSDWHTVYDRTRRSERITPVRIGNNVWIGDGACVLKGVTVGDNSVIAARAVVTRDVPANVIMAGNPAEVVKELDPERPIKTQAELYTDPMLTEWYIDAVNREVLAENSFFGWLRTLVRPTRED